MYLFVSEEFLLLYTFVCLNIFQSKASFSNEHLAPEQLILDLFMFFHLHSYIS